MMGWAVNSIAKAVEGSIPFLPIYNLHVSTLITSVPLLEKTKQLKRVGSMVRALCYGHKGYRFESYTRLNYMHYKELYK